MQMYVGITDYDWFCFLKERKALEVNFWKPGTKPFKALQTNDLFLFKLHAPRDYIVGGGFFVKYSLLPTLLAWKAFEETNGVKSLDELNRAIRKYRARNQMDTANPQIGCIILTDVFYFEEADWIPAPASFGKSIVQGKHYYLEEPDGACLYAGVTERLQAYQQRLQGIMPEAKRYTESMTKHRLGQGAFRVFVTDAYQRSCAITGEKTLPVLEAAHIKPYSKDGPHLVNNGLLLKSDFHTLYDSGYITINPTYHILVSRRLNEDFGSGRDYYKYNGKRLLILPERIADQPSKEYLQWHNENVYLG